MLFYNTFCRMGIPHSFKNKVLGIWKNMSHGILKVHAVKSSKILENTARRNREAIVDISKIYNHANEPSQL